MSRKPSPIPLDKALYDAVVAEAKRRFKWPSRNASWWVSGEYKRRGGVYAAAPRENPVGEDQRLTYAHDRHDGPGPDALAVVTVDGEYVRKNIDTDFTMGGNPSRYAYVPHGELWVEETLGENDTISTIVHEAIEHRLMANVALSYEDAHAAANEVDESLRAALDDDATDPLRLVVETPAGSFAVVVHLGDAVFDPNNVEIALVRPRKNPRTYEYQGEHLPPGPEGGAPLHDVESMMPDYYAHPEWYFTEGRTRREADAAAVVLAARGRPWAPVWVYRAVPPGVSTINPGDWVTTVRDYAKEHLDANLGGQGRILKAKVRAGSLFTEGNSHMEWGWYPDAEREREFARLLRERRATLARTT